MDITFFQANLGGEIIFHLARFVPDYDHIRPFGAWCQRFEGRREDIFLPWFHEVKVNERTWGILG